jgi:hypothetical protein
MSPALPHAAAVGLNLRSHMAWLHAVSSLCEPYRTCAFPLLTLCCRLPGRCQHAALMFDTRVTSPQPPCLCWPGLKFLQVALKPRSG